MKTAKRIEMRAVDFTRFREHIYGLHQTKIPDWHLEYVTLMVPDTGFSDWVEYDLELEEGIYEVVVRTCRDTFQQTALLSIDGGPEVPVNQDIYQSLMESGRTFDSAGSLFHNVFVGTVAVAKGGHRIRLRCAYRIRSDLSFCFDRIILTETGQLREPLIKVGEQPHPQQASQFQFPEDDFLPVAFHDFSDRESFRFVHFSDPHMIDLTGVHPNLYEYRKGWVEKDSNGCVARFVDLMNGVVKPDFVLCTGDLYDSYVWSDNYLKNRVSREFGLFREQYGRLTMPLYIAIGNHERYGLCADICRSGSTNDLQFFPHRIGHFWHSQLSDEATNRFWSEYSCFPGRFYYSVECRFRERSFHFVFLDNNKLFGTIFYPADSVGEYHYGVDERQLAWFREDLARNQAKIIILCFHFPLPEGCDRAGDGKFSKLDMYSHFRHNALQIMWLLDEHPNVVAIFAGHWHDANHAEYVKTPAGRLVPQISTGPFPSYGGEKNFRVAEANEHRMIVSHAGSVETELLVEF